MKVNRGEQNFLNVNKEYKHEMIIGSRKEFQNSLSQKNDTITISDEGFRRYRNNLQNNSLESVRREREKLVKISMDISGDYYKKLSEMENQFINKIKDETGSYDILNVAQTKMETFVVLYDQIKKEYSEGTREVWVSDDNGQLYKLTEDEDLQYLNMAYERKLHELGGFTWNLQMKERFQNKRSQDNVLEALNKDYQKELVKSMKRVLEEFEEQYSIEDDEQEIGKRIKKLFQNHLLKNTFIFAKSNELSKFIQPMVT